MGMKCERMMLLGFRVGKISDFSLSKWPLTQTEIPPKKYREK